MRLLSVLLALTVSTIGCGDTVIHNDIAGPSPTATVLNKIEFRVQGNASSARIRFSTPVDGLTQVVTSLPYIISIQTSQPSMFLSLEATPISYPFNVVNPFMAAQIVVNGSLFREATSNDLLSNTLSVNGTWRLGSASTNSSK